MDDTRFDELTKKRDDVGLTDDEADELGKMMAEREGATYENAEMVNAEETEPSSGPETEAGDPCGHVGCGCTTNEPFCSEFCQVHAHEPNEAGPAFDCGCEHDECKVVVGEA